MSARCVHFHEDDYCQIEILPASNREYCLQQMGNIAEFSEQHQAPPGLGWTDVWVRPENPTSISTLEIEGDFFGRMLSKHLPMFDMVTTGYGSQISQCKTIAAFGFDGGCVVYSEFDERSFVSRVWLGLNGPKQGEQTALLASFSSLSQVAPLILVDWGWDRLFDLDDCNKIQTYLFEREARFEQLAQEMVLRRNENATHSKKPWWKFFRSSE